MSSFGYYIDYTFCFGVPLCGLCEGLIDGGSCPREVGKRTLTRTHGRERIWLREGLIDGEACPREGGNWWGKIRAGYSHG